MTTGKRLVELRPRGALEPGLNEARMHQRCYIKRAIYVLVISLTALALLAPSASAQNAEPIPLRLERLDRALVFFIRGCVFALVVVVASGVCGQAQATYSVSACDQSGACGVAVATNNLAVGASVPYAEAGVGAIATQFETNPNYGPLGLALLKSGRSPDETIAALLAGDDNFEGQGIAFRQVAIANARGDASAYTGSEVQGAPWAGARRGRGYAIVGNGLAGDAVLAAMEHAFLNTDASLPERLLAALEAGQAAGGQAIGVMSAAVLVRTPERGFQDVDLRIDASPDPIADLRALLNLRRAHEAMLVAERAVRVGGLSEARAAADSALRLGARWDRIRRRAARLFAGMGEGSAAIDQLAALAELNPQWAHLEVRDPLYDSIRSNVRFNALLLRLDKD